MDRTRPKKLTEAERQGLDETRRLLYMVLVYNKTDRYELAGTLINTLLHHRKVTESRDEVIGLVVGGLNGDPDALVWLEAQGQRVAAELEQGG